MLVCACGGAPNSMGQLAARVGAAAAAGVWGVLLVVLPVLWALAGGAGLLRQLGRGQAARLLAWYAGVLTWVA